MDLKLKNGFNDTLQFMNIETVGNRAKRANLATGISRKQSTPNFPKSEHLLPPNTQYVMEYLFVRCSEKEWDIISQA